MSGCVLRLLRVGITVADLPRMQAFYQDALGFAPVGEATEADPAWARLLGTDGARIGRRGCGSARRRSSSPPSTRPANNTRPAAPPPTSGSSTSRS